MIRRTSSTLSRETCAVPTRTMVRSANVSRSIPWSMPPTHSEASLFIAYLLDSFKVKVSIIEAGTHARPQLDGKECR